MLSCWALVTAFCLLRCARADVERKASPLTDHLLKFLNNYDDSIIGFHLVVPKDEEIMNSYDSRPAPMSKVLEYVSQINFLREMLENDPEVSLKMERSVEHVSTTQRSQQSNKSDSEHTDLLIFSQMNPRTPGAPNSQANKDGDLFKSHPGSVSCKSVTNKASSGGKVLPHSSKKTSGRTLQDSLFDNFENGFRVFPLLSAPMSSGRRIRRDTKSYAMNENCAFLVQPRATTNPSILIFPPFMDPFLQQHSKRSKLRSKRKSKRSLDDYPGTGPDGSNSKKKSFTLLASVRDSAEVVPIKRSFGTNENRPDQKEINGVELNVGGTNYGKANLKHHVDGRANDENDSPSLNLMNNKFEDYRFADVLRECITDLVNGVEEEAPSEPYFDKEKLISNSSLSDYNVYLCLEPEQKFGETNLHRKPMMSGELFSSPRSKILKTVNAGGINNIMANFWSRFGAPGKTKDTNNIENGVLGDVNSFYKDKLCEILSHIKKNQNVLSRRKRNLKYSDKANVATFDGNKFIVKYNPKHFSDHIETVAGQNNLSYNREKRESTSKGSSKSIVLNAKYFLNKKRKKKSFINSGNKLVLGVNVSGLGDTMAFKRTNRSSGRVMMIPHRNFDLLIVYPYASPKNKKLNNIVSKCVKKCGYISEGKCKPAIAPEFNHQDDILRKVGNSGGIQLDNTMFKDMSRHKSGKMESVSKLNSEVLARLMDALNTDMYYEREGLNPEQSASLFSDTDFSKTENQNLTSNPVYNSKSPSLIPDYNPVKPLPGNIETLTPNISRSNLLNISSSASVEALKTPVESSDLNDDSYQRVFTTDPPELLVTDNQQPGNYMNPFHSSNGYRVSNATNLLIKLTELKSPVEPNVVGTDDPRICSHSTDPSVTNALLLMQKPSKPPNLKSYSTRRPFKYLFKSSKPVALAGVVAIGDSNLLKNDSNLLKNESIPLCDSSTEPNMCADDQGMAQSQQLDNGYKISCIDTKNNNVSQSGLNVSQVCYDYTFTNGYDSCVTAKVGLVPEQTIVHTTRPWALGGTVAPSEETEESTDDSEDSDSDSVYPDFAPVISVNIFPVLGGWKKPQIEATSLIRDLFRASQHYKVEEEQLPTYLSELFDVSENNSTQHRNIKVKDSVQKKLETILSGQCSVNDVLKLKLQNILQRSNRPIKELLADKSSLYVKPPLFNFY